MFDIVFSALAGLLSFFYGLVGNYAIAIGLLTLTVMLLLFPLNAKGMRGMAAMQKLNPELKKLQVKHKNDKAALNEETMALFKEHGASPVGGCLPMLLQAPVFFIMYNVIRGLVHKVPRDTLVGDLLIRKGAFDPKYLDHGSQLYRDLAGETHMRSFGVDLAKSASEVLKVSFVTAVPFLVLIAGVVATGYYQQRMMTQRNASANDVDNPMAKQMKQMLKIYPLMYLVFGFTLPAGLNVYFLISSIFRIGQQALIYKMDPSLIPDGAPASRTAVSRDVTATSEQKAKKPTRPASSGPSTNGRGSGNGSSAKTSVNGSGKSAAPPPARIANRPSNKKKKRR